MSKINTAYAKLRNVSTWMPLCRNCHAWIEENPSEAYELGFSSYRSIK